LRQVNFSVRARMPGLVIGCIMAVNISINRLNKIKT